eukprot:13129255-Heterocapsa_arctica.AAC.1
MVIRHEELQKNLAQAAGAAEAPEQETMEEKELARQQKEFAAEAEKQRVRIAADNKKLLQESRDADE